MRPGSRSGAGVGEPAAKGRPASRRLPSQLMCFSARVHGGVSGVRMPARSPSNVSLSDKCLLLLKTTVSYA